MLPKIRPLVTCYLPLVTDFMLGILGGTFDPIHIGHLRTGVEVKDALALRELRYIPCRLPPHRSEPAATPEQRLAMVAAALEGEEVLIGDGRELQREGPSYTVDTLNELREELGDEAIGLIIGADAFQEITSWYRWSQLIELAHLIVVHRPGWEMCIPADAAELLSGRVTKDRDEMAGLPAGLVWFQPVTPLQISATVIRENVRCGRSIRYLVPDTVERFINDQRLYLG